MPTRKLTIVGAGGHAAVVVDALLASGFQHGALRVLDEDCSKDGSNLLGVSVVAPIDPSKLCGQDIHVAIGENAARSRLASLLDAAGARFKSIIHPSASIAASAVVGEGCFVAAQSVVSSRVVLGRCVIVNHGAVVDHDCTVGESCHIAPKATLCGHVSVGRDTMIGSGAVLLPRALVGDGVVVGAGSVVLTTVPNGETWFGVPARKQNG